MSAPLRRHLARRVLRRARRSWADLLTIGLVVVAGFGLANTFVVASSSVLAGLHAFAEDHRQEAGQFQLGPRADGRDGLLAQDGVELVRSVDLGGVAEASVRVFPPRAEVNTYQVVAGRDLRDGDDLLLDARFADHHGLVPGERVRLGDDEYHLAGLATAPDYMTTKSSELELQPNPDRFGIGFVPAPTFDDRYAARASEYVAVHDAATFDRLVTDLDPAMVRDAANNSRIQQVLGDSEAPRDLAVLIFAVFTAVVVALLAVYHFETRRSEAAARATFDRLGLGSATAPHYRVETAVTLVLAWAVATAVCAVAARPVMGINGALYNYPRIELDGAVLWSLSLGTLVLLLLADLVVQRLVARPPVRSGRRRARVRAPRPSTLGLRAVRDVGLRLRVVTAARAPREPLSLLVLVAVVALFVNFALLLKTSVDEWVASLADDTPYSRMYLAAAGPPARDRPDDEPALMSTLYDAEGVAQVVLTVAPGSRMFPVEEDGATVTRAFAEKYDVAAGDTVRLADATGTRPFRFEVAAVAGSRTSAMVYDVDPDLAPPTTADGGAAAALPVLFTARAHPDLEDVVPTVSREAVVSSGAQIVRIIDAQVSLLVGIALAMLVLLLWSVYRFTHATRADMVRVLRRNGIGAAGVNRALFGFTVPAVVLLVALAYLGARVMVREFFDRIMATFTSYVPASAAPVPLLVTTAVVLATFAVVAWRSRTRVARA
ncbi:hypothetical protein [Cellulomonas sp.]|uniref:hypothetical protein n=1 Tax=Cellulomonas sp. TaxID=40001 RepID=UPI0028115F38|nr:hypothetical protein [Cellulomonas sp.]